MKEKKQEGLRSKKRDKYGKWIRLKIKIRRKRGEASAKKKRKATVGRKEEERKEEKEKREGGALFWTSRTKNQIRTVRIGWRKL